jgi:putative inorganic carbon (hco3(-)) transporter
MTSFLHKIFLGSLYALVFGLPLVFFQGFDFTFETTKIVYFRVFLSILLFLSIFLSCNIIFSFKKTGKYFWWILCIFFLFLFLSLLWSSSFTTSFFGVSGRWQGVFSYGLYFLFALLILRYQPSVNAWKGVVISFLLSTTCVSILGIMQIFSEYFSFFPLFSSFADAEFLGRIYSTMGQPNYLAYLLLFSIPFLGYLTFFHFSAKKYLFFWICFSAFLLQVITFFLTGSRGAWLALLIAIIVFAFIEFKKRSHNILLLFAGIFLLFCILAFLFVWRDNITGEGFRSFFSRFEIWKSAWKIFFEYPFGIGMENFSFFYPQYMSIDIFQYEQLTHIADRVHNDFLQKIVELGFIGGFLWILLWHGLLKSMYNLFEKNVYMKPLFITVLSLFFGSMINFFTTVHYVFFFLIIAYVLSFYLVDTHKVYNFSFLRFILIGTLSSILFPQIALWSYAEIQYNKADVLKDSNDYYAHIIQPWPFEYRFHYSWWQDYFPEKNAAQSSYNFVQKQTKGHDFETFLWRARLVDLYDNQNNQSFIPFIKESLYLAPLSPIPYYYASQYFQKHDYSDVFWNILLSLLPQDCRSLQSSHQLCKRIYKENPWIVQ